MTNSAPASAEIRSKVEPGDVPPVKAARRLHLTLAQFREKLPELLARGFPAPDPTTGFFDLDAIDAWRRARNPQLFPESTCHRAPASHSRKLIDDRIERL